MLLALVREFESLLGEILFVFAKIKDQLLRAPSVRILSTIRRESTREEGAANNYRSRKQKNKARYPFVVLKPTRGLRFSRSVQQKRERRDFRT